MSEFRNEWVEVTLHHKPGCQIQLETKVFPPCIQKAKKEAIKKVSHEVKLPGFRQGKAPEEFILKNYGKEVEESTKKALGDVVFSEVYKLVKVRPLNNSSTIHYDLKNFTPEAADVVFSYEVEPEVPSIDVASFSLQKMEKPTIGEKEVQEAIRQMQFFYAEWKEITDRPIQEGDYLILDLESLETTPPTQVFSATRFEVSDKGMAKWMRDLVLGESSKAVIEGMSASDPSLTEEEKKNFPPRRVKIVIQKIEEAKLPLIDEEFLKKVRVSSEEELQKMVKSILERQISDNEKKVKEDQVKHFVLQQATFELPKSLVEEERKHRFNQIMQDEEAKERYNNLSKEGKEAADRDLLQQSKDAIYFFYLSRKLLEDAKIAFTQQEMEEAILPYKNQKLSKDHMYGLAFARLVLIRAEDYLLELAEKKLDQATPQKLE
ncbi:MAG: trigger factor [Chlamydiota bacterium]